MAKRKLALLTALLAAIVAVVVATASGGGATPIEPQVVDDSTLKALTTTEGGADVLPTTRTVAHWFGQTTNPHNGITYGYNMVGSNPNSCSGPACSTTIEADITPIIVHIGGWTFDGTSVVGATLASPQFATDDYGSTPNATAAGAFPSSPKFIRGPGGALSQNDAGVPLQLEDATMRAQFNKTGLSNYHLMLHPNVLPAVTIDVPSNQGTVLVSGRGVVAGDINISWWSAQIQNLESKADATHLPIYLTDNVFLHIGPNVLNCCVLGYHGTRAAGFGNGNTNSNGNAVVQTFAWASYVRRLREGDEYLRAGPEPERHAECRRVLPPGGRSVPPVVHASAEQQHRLGSESDERGRSLHVDGRPEPVPGLPPAGNRLLGTKLGSN